ncbi:MAG: diguanylate cyclase (GGDEF)-like protein [Porticoccaceae bacterium]|jgi:diguanylate cyclase (GGDEF)-like protein
MSLRSKVVGTLLSVFVLYALLAWLALEVVYTSAFDRLERDNASNQLTRISHYIDTERADVNLLVNDWANWNDTMAYVSGEYNEYYKENLAESYLSELGMSFGAVVDPQGRLIFGEVYLADGTIEPLDYLLPDGIQQGNVLMSPVASGELISGLMATAQGPAIVSSSAIFRSSGRGIPGGYLIVGKLLDAERMETVSYTMLTPIDILSVEHNKLPEQFHQTLEDLVVGKSAYAIKRQGAIVYALLLLRDVEDKPLGLLRAAIPTKISMLGTNTLQTTVLALVIAALVLTLILWITLKEMLLVPLEHLTHVLTGRDDEHSEDESGQYLLSTVQRLVDSRGSISKRNDEIGELFGAFDKLSSSLRKATNSVWRVAHIDGLTGLANRRLFMERLTRAIDTRGGAQKLTVLFIDLDNFKFVNDQHGHEIGDQLLIDVAHRLQSVLGKDKSVIGPTYDSTRNVVARIGGDEFVLLLSSDERPEYASNVASSIVESIGSPFIIAGISCQIGACVGMAVYPEDADGVNGILSKADSAMYEAKRAGKSCWRRFVPGLSRSGEKKSA